ncbi:MAG TPA: 4-hydroxy-tetrahydrodipicolinate synthase [Gammaproteobacteria bacterium]|jgi:4-hydroxy-tetrahydrodipicolinate synthase|nr:4-hydroxy-tetrahydrodipicolinate synthase [Gammaproteobacteria bacterium]
MFKGSMVALVTPMADDGRVDLEALDALVEWHVAEGTDAIVAIGTTGEASTLEGDEQLEVVARCVRAAAGRVPVIAGATSNATAHAVQLSRRAEALGADAVLSAAPYYNKPGQEGLYRHFYAVAQAVSVPVLLYNVPSRTITDILPETVERLAKLPNVVGIKEATGDLKRAADIQRRCGKDFLLISGDDATARECMLQGGRGVITVTANVAPRLMHEMCMAALAGDGAKAAALDGQLALLHKALFVESNPIPVKWALAEMRRIPPGIRLPLTPLTAEHQPAVRAALKAARALA